MALQSRCNPFFFHIQNKNPKGFVGDRQKATIGTPFDRETRRILELPQNCRIIVPHNCDVVLVLDRNPCAGRIKPTGVWRRLCGEAPDFLCPVAVFQRLNRNTIVNRAECQQSCGVMNRKSASVLRFWMNGRTVFPIDDMVQGEFPVLHDDVSTTRRELESQRRKSKVRHNQRRIASITSGNCDLFGFCEISQPLPGRIHSSHTADARELLSERPVSPRKAGQPFVPQFRLDVV